MKEIPLSNGGFVKVDDLDYELLIKFRWFRHVPDKKNHPDRAYAHRTTDNKPMHRFLLNLTSNFDGDHIDGNGLNNQRSNIRKATHLQNSQNKRKSKTKKSSIYKGAFLYSRRTDRWVFERWYSTICVDGKKIVLGKYFSDEEAAHSYDIGARKYFKRFANVNFPNKTDAQCRTFIKNAPIKRRKEELKKMLRENNLSGHYGKKSGPKKEVL